MAAQVVMSALPVMALALDVVAQFGTTAALPPITAPHRPARGESVFVGLVCAVFWAGVWAFLYRFAVPRLRQVPLEASWGHAALKRQRVLLAEVGFPLATDPMQGGLSEDEAADMFAWICLTAIVHITAGSMTLPVVVRGWDVVGVGSHLMFFTGTWFILGWSLFDAVDESLRCFGREHMPTGVSGMQCACPRRFWGVTCLVHHPFWFTLILPMNALLCDLGAYHLVVCALLLGGGMQLAVRQFAIVFAAMGRKGRRAHRWALLLQAPIVLLGRGAAYFPFAIDCATKLSAANPATVFAGPAILMGLLNIAMMMESLRVATYCSTNNAPEITVQQARPLRTTEGGSEGIRSPGMDGDALDAESAQQHRSNGARPSKTSRSDRPRKGRSKRNEERNRRGKAAPGAARQRGEPYDEEVSFGCGGCGGSDLEYDDDADDDATLVGEDQDFPGARQPTRSSGTQQPRGRDAPDRPLSPSCAESSRQARSARRAAEAEAHDERERLRREVADARREMERKQQQQQQHERRQQSASVPQPADLQAIFESGQVPKLSHYAVLGVAPNADADEIRKAFRLLSVKWHPDKNPAEAAKAELVFMRIKDAYECLSDATKRRRYDRAQSKV